MYPLTGNRKDRAHTQERPYEEPNINPETGNEIPIAALWVLWFGDVIRERA
jgi:hypothetical protein